MKIIGSYVSPYVRKVLACLYLKGLPYEIDPITPFFGNDEFERLSPVRRIPVLIDGDLTLTDSSVICAYLDEAYGGYPLLPEDPKDRARARWVEEYADTRLGDVFIWGLFYQRFVRPLVWGEPADNERVEKTLSEMRRPRSITWKRNCRAAASCSARSGSPTSRSQASSATPLMSASSRTRAAGRMSRASSAAYSAIPRSPRCCRSKTCSAASRSGGGAKRSSLLARP